MIVASRQVSSAADDADQERVAPAVEEARGDVAALVVGAEQVVRRVPGRPDRRHAEPEPARLLLHHGRRVLPLHDRRAVEVRAERIGVRDVVRVERRREAEQRRSATSTPSIAIATRLRSSAAPASAHGARADGGSRASSAAPRPRALSLIGRESSGGRARARPHARLLLDPRLVDEPVELLAEGEVADALRDEVDVLRVEQRRHRRRVRHRRSIFVHRALAASSSVDASASALCICALIFLSQKPAMLMLESLPGWNESQPNRT